MLEIKHSTFVKSIIHLNERPRPLLPEFAIAGRSNVGKSSLINCVLNRKNLANVSKQPGKTRTINYFLVNKTFYIVDLPGYGFARVPHQEKKKWREMVENYIMNSKELKLIFVVIDASIPTQQNDLQLIEWLKFINKPYQLIATKSDKMNMASRQKRLREFQTEFMLKPEQNIILFSSKNRQGRDDVLLEISKHL
ncbi:MAG: ribosome biogenesis GTP-binding protein YihA/YsxC [Calditrichia bacterium]